MCIFPLKPYLCVHRKKVLFYLLETVSPFPSFLPFISFFEIPWFVLKAVCPKHHPLVTFDRQIGILFKTKPQNKIRYLENSNTPMQTLGMLRTRKTKTTSPTILANWRSALLLLFLIDNDDNVGLSIHGRCLSLKIKNVFV